MIPSQTQSAISATYNPLAWQVAPFTDKARILLLTGSAGGGKSRVAAEKVHAYCLKYPSTTGVIGRKDKVTAGRSVVPFMLSSIMGDTEWGVFKVSYGLFQYHNGSQLWVAGFAGEEQREAMKSIGARGGLDIAWFEEANALTEDDHNLLLTRMRGRAADWTQIIYTTNPDAPAHWINRRLIIGGEASVYYSRAADNPHNPPEYAAALDQLTGVMRLRLRDGMWAQAQGVVYDNFSKEAHVTSRPLSDFRAFGLAMDEGYTNPAVILLIGEDADGRWHVCREYYRRGVLQAEVVRVAREWAHERGVYLAAVDAAAAGLVADLLNNSVPAKAAKGRVLDGIQAIQDRLRVQGDGRPRLTIEPDCTNLINEFESYTWKPQKDEPVKENDHALDALRYYNDAAGGQWWVL